MKHQKLNSVLIILSFVVLITYVIWAEGFENLVNGFSVTNPFILLLAFSLIFIYWFLESVITHIVIKVFHPTQRFKNTIKTSMIGQFFNSVTPFASGGQPMQAYSLVKSGVPLGTATCSLLIKFIIYQTTLTVYSIAMLLLKFSYFTNSIQGFKYLVILGFSVNTVVVLALLSVFLFKNFTTKAAHLLVRLGNKIRIIKDIEQANKKIDDEIEGFYNSFTILKQNLSLVVKSAILTVLQLTVFFMIPYVLSFAFNIYNTDALTMISAQSFVAMISSFVPLPGAAGGAEVSFYIFFEMFFKNFVKVAMLIWRIITFYFPIAFGVFFVFSFKKKGDIPDEEK